MFTASLDYQSESGSFVLTPSDPRACLNVTILDDDILELDEDFSATLTGMLPPGAAFDLTSTEVLIEDNECESTNVRILTYCIYMHVKSLTN